MNNIVGYTTINQQNGSLRLDGLELAKRDLINHFHIRKGEKWTDPDFGSNLLEYVFQPLDDFTTDAINEEVNDIVSYDPRFELDRQSIVVDQDTHSVTVTVKLLYLPTTTATDLQIKFDSDFTEQAEF
jgi:phage baseplate assembly protein W